MITSFACAKRECNFLISNICTKSVNLVYLVIYLKVTLPLLKKFSNEKLILGLREH